MFDVCYVFCETTCKKIVVASPSSLVSMWQTEVRKWLGNERLVAHIVEAGNVAKEAIDNFCSSRLNKLLIISYDMLRRYSEKLQKGKVEILVCDEAHRLKDSSKTMLCLENLQCSKRILLTGTVRLRSRKNLF